MRRIPALFIALCCLLAAVPAMAQTATQTEVFPAFSFAISPDGKYMIVSNQDTSTVFTWALREDGCLVPTGSVAYVDQPVCVKFVEVCE